MTRFVLAVLSCAVVCAPLLADAPAAQLKEFSSKAGRFSVLLPGTPQQSTVPEPGGNDGAVMQYQFTVDAGNGALVVSYQDNPNLKGASDERLQEALARVQDKVRAGFGGNPVSSKPIKLAGRFPGLDYQCDIPAAGGIYRSRSYLVDTRLYQVIAVGAKEFATSPQTEQVLGSFKLLD